MRAYHNGVYVDEKDLCLKIDNRAFLYGDGFFETMLGYGGKVKWLRYHVERITAALGALSIDPPEALQLNQCEAIVDRLLDESGLRDCARVRLHAWRAPGGTYAPESRDARLLISLEARDNPGVSSKARVSFCSGVKNSLTAVSQYKSMNAQLYVLAALEMKQMGCDDVLITDTSGHISECLVSNVFWVRDETIFTPSLRTGCVGGVGRRVVCEALKKQGREVREVEAPADAIMQADHVFTSNALGLANVLQIDDRSFQPFPDIGLLAQLYQ